jgi:hypothetical protein
MEITVCSLHIIQYSQYLPKSARLQISEAFFDWAYLLPLWIECNVLCMHFMHVYIFIQRYCMKKI